MAHFPKLLETLRHTRSASAVMLVAFVLLTLAARPAVAVAGPGDGSNASGPATASIPISPGVCEQPYIYAMQVTGTSTSMHHDDCMPVNQVYEGWIGIDGQITTPAATVNLVQHDHAAGWLGMVSYKQPANGLGASWIQIGWYTGYLQDCNNGNTISGYEMYVEWNSTDSSGPKCQVLGSLSLGSAVTYRIVFANGCWSAYYNYDVLAAPPVCGLPSSMSAQAVNEFDNLASGGRDTTMPRSVFGSSDPNTNAALRIKGASGWQPWNTSLEAGGTIQVDRRTSCPCYYISSYQEFYNELTY